MIRVDRDGAETTIASFEHDGHDAARAHLDRVERVTWTAPDGWDIQGLVHLPVGAAPFPLLVFVHGGPVAAYQDEWIGVGDALLLSRGYALFAPNPRGSSGRGRAFAEAVVGDMGGADAADVLTGIDHLVAAGLADPARIGVVGGSYGGFMAAWLPAIDQRFAVSVAISPVTDWTSQHFTSSLAAWDQEFVGADPFDPCGVRSAEPGAARRLGADADAPHRRAGRPGDAGGAGDRVRAGAPAARDPLRGGHLPGGGARGRDVSRDPGRTDADARLDRAVHARSMNEPDTAHPSFGEAVRFWVMLGFINFGGPTGQIAIMHRELVERRRWIGEDAFLHALSFCMLLPGPEAQQLAIYIGWLLHRIRGGVVAGVMFVLPAAIAMLGLAWLYAAHGEVAWVASVFESLAAAVVGIVAVATIAIAGRAVRSRTALTIAAAAFLAIWLVGVPFPIVVAAAAAAGLAAGTARLGVPDQLEVVRAPEAAPSLRRTLLVAGVALAVWWVPILLVVAVAGGGSVIAREGVFFSQASLVTFGGAYAVLAYVGREVTTRFGLLPGDVVTGLGLAETTPGPLILVVEFLAFLAAYRAPGSASPVVAGTMGAIVALWATFAPCFLWVFVGAPYVEGLRANARLRAAFAGITAAVLGIVASLAVTVGTAVLFDEVSVVRPLLGDIAVPHWSSLDVGALATAVAAFAILRSTRVHVAWVVLGSVVLGLAEAALR